MNKIKVIIADDHPAFREGLYRLLDDEEDIEVVAKSCSQMWL
jgi:DNA-binding NarL/FixJ family response regulator